MTIPDTPAADALLSLIWDLYTRHRDPGADSSEPRSDQRTPATSAPKGRRRTKRNRDASP